MLRYCSYVQQTFLQTRIGSYVWKLKITIICRKRNRLHASTKHAVVAHKKYLITGENQKAVLFSTTQTHVERLFVRKVNSEKSLISKTEIIQSSSRWSRYINVCIWYGGVWSLSRFGLIFYFNTYHSSDIFTLKSMNDYWLPDNTSFITVCS
jgi:hypothetical protein